MLDSSANVDRVVEVVPDQQFHLSHGTGEEPARQRAIDGVVASHHGRVSVRGREVVPLAQNARLERIGSVAEEFLRARVRDSRIDVRQESRVELQGLEEE